MLGAVGALAPRLPQLVGFAVESIKAVFTLVTSRPVQGGLLVANILLFKSGAAAAAHAATPGSSPRRGFIAQPANIAA